MNAIDHDRLFKELITTFFSEFLELFYPEVLAYSDCSEITFLDKEIFTDVTSGDEHQVDVVAKVKWSGKEAFFLVHVENQASAQSEFSARMFRYFARLHEKHGVPVYPIAIFSFASPKRLERDVYTVSFPDIDVLQFRYRTIQLNQLNWREYVRTTNPVASALMSVMNIAVEDRPYVKLECLRLLATLQLDRARMRLISGFVDNYLRLTKEEYLEYERALTIAGPKVKEKVMSFTTSWKEEGRKEGRQEGRQEGEIILLVRLLQRRLGNLPEQLRNTIQQLPIERIEQLFDDQFAFESIEDIENWITNTLPH